MKSISCRTQFKNTQPRPSLLGEQTPQLCPLIGPLLTNHHRASCWGCNFQNSLLGRLERAQARLRRTQVATTRSSVHFPGLSWSRNASVIFPVLPSVSVWGRSVWAYIARSNVRPCHKRVDAWAPLQRLVNTQSSLAGRQGIPAIKPLFCSAVSQQFARSWAGSVFSRVRWQKKWDCVLAFR